MSFSSLGLDSSLLNNLAGLGYAAPTPVQREAIPAALAGGDLLVSSQTGSGKTAAFVLPGLQRLRTPARIAGKGPRMLVLAPTRELAMRVQKERQTLLFSATLGGVVGRLAGRVTRNPKRIEITRKEEAKLDITQHALVADNAEHKNRMLDRLLNEAEVDQALVFTAMKRTAAELTNSLVIKGFTAGALHGDMHQKERTRTLNRVRDGSLRVLVATDVAARGIDVPGINLVVNYDAPRMAEEYVHRIGRTGRAGRAGVAITFLGHDDRHLVRQVERFTGNRMAMMEIEGLEPRTRIEEAPKWRKKAPRPTSGNRANRSQGRERRFGR